jgi:hypothetical protein
MTDIVKRLREPPFGTETSERNLMNAAADEITALRAEVEKLRAALKPFADESLWCGPQHEFVSVKRSDCDRARAAITQETRYE